MYLRALKPAILAMIFFTLLLGIIYPFLIMSIGQVFTPKTANGSLVIKNHQVIGSSLIAQQPLTGYFISRPSANHYNPLASGGSNAALNNPKLSLDIKTRMIKLHDKYGNQPIPEELLFSSGSGLDPEIGYNTAVYQAKYVAKKQGLKLSKVMGLIKQNTHSSIFNPTIVNVLELNLALKNAHKMN